MCDVLAALPALFPIFPRAVSLF